MEIDLTPKTREWFGITYVRLDAVLEEIDNAELRSRFEAMEIKPEPEPERPLVQNWTISKYPTHCRKCPFYHEVEYWVHNDRGDQGICDLGYHREHDTRDRTVWEYCEIRTDPRVICHEEKPSEPIQIPEDELGI